MIRHTVRRLRLLSEQLRPREDSELPGALGRLLREATGTDLARIAGGNPAALGAALQVAAAAEQARRLP